MNKSLQFQKKCYICEFQSEENECQCFTCTSNYNGFQYILFNSINLFVCERVLQQINSYLEKNLPKQNILIVVKDGKLTNITSLTNSKDTFINQCYLNNLSLLSIETTTSKRNIFKNNFTFKLPEKHLKLYSKL